MQVVEWISRGAGTVEGRDENVVFRLEGAANRIAGLRPAVYRPAADSISAYGQT